MAPISRTGNTRVIASSKKSTISVENIVAGKSVSFSKRKAENSPPKNRNFKRPALNDLTNDGKTAKVKNLIKKNCKSNVEVPVDKSVVKLALSAPATRSKSTKFVSGIKIPGPFKGRCNVNPQLSESNSSSLKSTENFKSKSTAKLLPKTATVTRSSLSSKSNVGKTVKSDKISSEKFVSETCKIHHVSNEVSAVKPVLPSKLKLRSSVSNSTSQNEEIRHETTLRRSLRNHAEGSEVSIQSLVSIVEKNESRQPSQPGTIDEESERVIKLRRSLRNNVEKTEIPTQIINDKNIIDNESERNEESRRVVKLRKSLRNVAEKSEVSTKTSDENFVFENDSKISRRSSTRLSLRKSLSIDKSTENGSLYISALEEINNSINEQDSDTKQKQYCELSEFDKELLHDPQQVSLYAMEIFDYLKSRESHFPILDYMSRQPHIDKKMRAMLVDWMVEVQENFELNHETLYLSVKLLDSYLSHVEIRRESLQLVGAAALFLSCKYDERLSPMIDEFEYVGDGAYDKNCLLTMEQNILRHVNYELSFPISYSFLRRYARCARIQMPLLTLARYILELGLMEYDIVTLSDSKQAAAVLYLAFQMVKHSKWTHSLKYYTGYDVADFKDIVLLFNRILHQKPSSQLMTIRNKYSHELFFKVALTPLLNDEDLNLND